MLGHQALDGLGAKQASARKPFHCMRDVRPELVREPAWKRHHEALLLAVDDIGRQITPGEPLQDALALAAAYLERGRKARAPTVELVVEIGDSCFERERHRRAVDLGEKVVGQPQPRVDVEEVVEVFRRIAGVVNGFRVIGDARARGTFERRRKKFVAQQRIENVGDRRVASRTRLGRGLEDAVAAKTRRKPAGKPWEG